MKKNIILFLVLLNILILCSCRTMIKNYNNQNNPIQDEKITFSYEEAEAIVKKVDNRHWFATTHRYSWDMEVYCEKYDLTHNEVGWANGAFAMPIFFESKIGDIVIVEIRNTYQGNELIEREILRLK